MTKPVVATPTTISGLPSLPPGMGSSDNSELDDAIHQMRSMSATTTPPLKLYTHIDDFKADFEGRDQALRNPSEAQFKTMISGMPKSERAEATALRRKANNREHARESTARKSQKVARRDALISKLLDVVQRQKGVLDRALTAGKIVLPAGHVLLDILNTRPTVNILNYAHTATEVKLPHVRRGSSSAGPAPPMPVLPAPPTPEASAEAAAMEAVSMAQLDLIEPTELLTWDFPANLDAMTNFWGEV